MIQITTKLSGNIGGLGPNSASLFRRRQMELIGNFALKAVLDRTRLGIGSNDVPFPPLSQKKSGVFVKGKFVRQREGYGAWKARHGLNPSRDLVGTGKQGGHMLDNPSVRSVSEDTVRIAFTSRSARSKALTNERRTPFFSFSQRDERLILQYARSLFGQAVEALRRDIAAGRRAA